MPDPLTQIPPHLTFDKPADLTPAICVKSLRGTTCPACGSSKRGANSLCGSCYHALPRDLKLALYKRRVVLGVVIGDRLGHSYDRALFDALRYLDALVVFI